MTHPMQGCNASGCTELVPVGRGGMCDKHRKATNKLREQMDGTRSERGYDKTWFKLRAVILQRDPICKIRIACAHEPVGRLSTQVDHIVPIRVAPHLRLAVSNLQGCCGACNLAKRDEDLKKWPVG